MFKNETLQSNVFASFLIISLIVVGHFFVDGPNIVSVMWPAFGVACIYYYFYGKRILLTVVLSVLTANVVMVILLTDQVTLVDILMRFASTLATTIELLLFKKIYANFKKYDYKSTKSIAGFLFAGFIATFVGATFISVLIRLAFGDSVVITNVIIRWMIGDLTGLIVFGSLLYCILKEKEHFQLSILPILFNVAFLFFSHILFSGILGELNFSTYGYLFILFFIAGILWFNHTMTFLMTLEFLLFYQFLYIDVTLSGISEYDLSLVIIQLNIFLITLVSVSIILKGFYDRAIKNAKLHKQKSLELEAIFSSTYKFFNIGEQVLSKQLTLNEQYLKNMFDIAITIFQKYDAASCYIKKEGKIFFVDAIGYDLTELNKINLDYDKFTIDNDKTLYLVDTDMIDPATLNLEYEPYYSKVSTVRESICIGIRMENDIAGGITLDLSKDSKEHYTKQDIKSLESFQKYMNAFYAQSITNVKNQNIISNVVHTLIATLELYDNYTGDHSEDVAILAVEIGERMHLSKDQLTNLYWAGICHDIGKIGISQDIINKPDKLTKEEYEEVKKHADYSYRLLNQNEELKEVAKIVRHHHEWYNGEGYPDHLTHKDTPIESQILMVSDSICSMATKRPYNKIKTDQEIIEELLRYSKIQFNPRIVDHAIILINQHRIDQFREE